MTYKNIKPDIWGPPLWKFLHYLSMAYPANPTDKDKEKMLNFLQSLQEILPCEKCRISFNKHLDELNMDDLKSDETFVKWLFNVHNKVNTSNNKPELSYEDFIKMYSITNNNNLKEIKEVKVVSKPEIKNGSCPQRNNIIIGTVVVIILIILVNKYL